jgi:hypothetical protein
MHVMITGRSCVRQVCSMAVAAVVTQIQAQMVVGQHQNAVHGGDAEQGHEADGGGHAEGVPVTHSAKNAAQMAMGMTLAASSASRRLPNFKYSSSTIRAMDNGTATLKRAMASCRLPNSPTHSRR